MKPLIILLFSTIAFSIQAQENKTVTSAEAKVGSRLENDESHKDKKIDESKFPSMDVIEVKRKGRYLLGKVVTVDGGEPLIGVLVKAVGKKGAPPFSASTRRGGEFHVMAPPGDEYTFVVTMTKYKTLKKKAE